MQQSLGDIAYCPQLWTLENLVYFTSDPASLWRSSPRSKMILRILRMFLHSYENWNAFACVTASMLVVSEVCSRKFCLSDHQRNV